MGRGSLDTVLIASTDVYVPKKGVNVAGPKALAVMQAPGMGSQEAILEASQVMLGDIDGVRLQKRTAPAALHIV